MNIFANNAFGVPSRALSHQGISAGKLFCARESMYVVGGSASRLLASELAKCLSAKLARVEVKRFPDDECYVRIEDDLSPIDGQSLFYRVSTNGGITFSGWESMLYFGQTKQTVELLIEPQLTEGRENLIQFKGGDIADSGIVQSEEFPILVDQKAPSVSMKEPAVDENGTTVQWLRDETDQITLYRAKERAVSGTRRGSRDDPPVTDSAKAEYYSARVRESRCRPRPSHTARPASPQSAAHPDSSSDSDRPHIRRVLGPWRRAVIHCENR